jgi:hypothetical protein
MWITAVLDIHWNDFLPYRVIAQGSIGLFFKKVLVSPDENQLDLENPRRRLR